MRKIHKFPMPPPDKNGRFVIEVNTGAKFLAVVKQQEQAMLYFEVETEFPALDRLVFYTVLTGGLQLDKALTDCWGLRYRGTVLFNSDQSYVVHYYQAYVKEDEK